MAHLRCAYCILTWDQLDHLNVTKVRPFPKSLKSDILRSIYEADFPLLDKVHLIRKFSLLVDQFILVR
jgi:hypothetical protein